MKTLTRDDTEHGAEYVLRSEAEAAIQAAVAAERKQCAEICDGIAGDNKWSDAATAADAIRSQLSAPGPAP